MSETQGTAVASVSASGEGSVRVEGDLVFNTVVGLRGQLLAALSKGTQQMDVDLSGVSRADSSGLSLLLEWQRLATARGVHLSYRHLPSQLGAIADLSELRPVLALKD